MEHRAMMEMIKGESSEVVGKVRHCQEVVLNPENSTFVDSAIKYVEDTDKSEWNDACILTDMTCMLTTFYCRLPTNVCRGNPDTAHKLVSSTLMHLFHQAFIEKMSNELVLEDLFRQKAVREAKGKQLRESFLITPSKSTFFEK